MLLNEAVFMETMFDAMPFNVYVMDVESYKIIYMNKTMIKAREDNYSGELCYKALYEEEKPCYFCKVKDLVDDKKKPNGRTIVFEHFNEYDDTWYQVQEKAILMDVSDLSAGYYWLVFGRTDGVRVLRPLVVN